MLCEDAEFYLSKQQMPFFDNLKTIRERAGIRVSALAKAAGLDRGTISRIEKHSNSTPPTLHSIVNALNELHYNNGKSPISYNDVVTEISKYGGKK